MEYIELKDDRSEKVAYNYEEYPICTRKTRISLYDNFAATPHWHDDIEFVAVVKGEMNYNVNGENIFMKQGEGVFVNSRQFHYGYSKDKKECEFIYALIHPMMLCVTQPLEQKFILPLVRNQNISYIKLTADIPWKKEVLDTILHICQAKDNAGAPLTILSMFMKIWSLIYENTDNAEPERVYNSDLIVLKNMVGYIQKYYCEKVTLADIAAAGAVGQSKCCKVFDKYIGTTPNVYLIQYRLNRSIRYLKDTDMTITEIAQAVGFSGSSYYAEVFRKYYRKSPSAYRKTRH